jgi:hypothetical protein
LDFGFLAKNADSEVLFCALAVYKPPPQQKRQRGCQSEAGAVRNLDSEFAEVDLATGAREASEVLEVEQYRNNVVGDVENIF